MTSLKVFICVKILKIAKGCQMASWRLQMVISASLDISEELCCDFLGEFHSFLGEED